MQIEGGYTESTSTGGLRLSRTPNNRGMNLPCPEELCIHTFSNRQDLDDHLQNGDHLSREVALADECTDDRVKMSWLAGLSGQLSLRKSGKLNKIFIIHSQDIF